MLGGDKLDPRQVFSPGAASLSPHETWLARRPNRLMAMASADAPMKGLDVLLQAFAALRRERPDLELVVVGKPHEGGRTERLVRKLALGRPELRFVREVPHERLVELYAEARRRR